jgi:hypothetical protein
MLETGGIVVIACLPGWMGDHALSDQVIDTDREGYHATLAVMEHKARALLTFRALRARAVGATRNLGTARAR